LRKSDFVSELGEAVGWFVVILAGKTLPTSSESEPLELLESFFFFLLVESFLLVYAYFRFF